MAQAVFNKPVGKIDISAIDNVLIKPKGTFKKYTVQDWGDFLLQDKEIKNILATDKANNVANTDFKFDPSVMGVTGYTLLKEFFYNEEHQRLVDLANSKRLLRTFNLQFFTCVFCVNVINKESEPFSILDGAMNLVTLYMSTVDGWHHLIDLYLELRAGNIKGWDPEDWENFPVPTQTWTTDDPTLPGNLALMLNGEGQSKWGEFEFLRIHSNNYRLYPMQATTQDKLAYDQVMTCLNLGNTVLLPNNHTDAKETGVFSHIGAVTHSANAEIPRLEFIMSQNEKWWPLEERSSAMFGFYGNIYDEFVRNHKPLSGTAFEDQILNYHYILQQVFGNLSKAMKAIKGKHGALKKLETLSNQGWKSPSGDTEVLAVVEIIYKDYLKGPHRISATRGSYVWTDSKKQQQTVVDALMKLPNTSYAQIISSL